MLEELERRHYSPNTIRCYVRVVAEFALHPPLSAAAGPRTHS
jgi:hypothetical protein